MDTKELIATMKGSFLKTFDALARTLIQSNCYPIPDKIQQFSVNANGGVETIEWKDINHFAGKMIGISAITGDIRIGRSKGAVSATMGHLIRTTDPYPHPFFMSDDGRPLYAFNVDSTASTLMQIESSNDQYQPWVY